MLTKEQEIKIRGAAATAWSTAVPGMSSVAEAVVAGIKYYDYLKEAEEVKAANDIGINEMLLDEAIKYFLMMIALANKTFYGLLPGLLN